MTKRIVSAVLFLVIGCGLSGCKGPAHTSVSSNDAGGAGKETVTLVERASSSDDSLDEIRADIRSLRQQLAALSSRIPAAESSDVSSRLSELEKQVGIRAYARKPLTDLWSEVARIGSQLNGYQGLTSRIDSLEDDLADLAACVQKMRQNWGSQYAPYC